MIEDANISIRRADEAAVHRRLALLARRFPVQLLDHWLSEVEALVERNEPVVPDLLLRQIARFLERQDPLLVRKVRMNATALHVLDFLFEAEEELLVRLTGAVDAAS